MGVVDSDVGQSTFGPPTTISMVTLSEPAQDLLSLRPKSLYFVGNNSPRGHFLEVVAGTKMMVDKARSGGCSAVVVDTSGLITPVYGTILKFHKIELVGPSYVVAFERADELEEILLAIGGRKSFGIKHLKVPKGVKRISPNERYERRKKSYRRYFSSAQEQRIERERVFVYPPKLDFLKMRDSSNLLVGLRDELGETLGIGILTAFDEQMLKVLTPVSDPRKVSALVVGVLRVEPSGDEAARITPFRFH